MVRRIGPQLLAELEWETLLGLEKEARELRDLCKRRQAERYVVFSDDHGFRIAGMVSEDPEPGAQHRHALAAILCLRAAGQALVFIHTLEEDDTQAIVIAIKSGRPELDRVLEKHDAIHEAMLFVETVESPVQVLGNLSVPGVETVATPIPLSDTLSAKEREVSALSRPFLRSNGKALTVLAMLLALTGGVGTLAWLLWPAPAPVLHQPAVTAEVRQDYYDQMRTALARALDKPGHQAAEAIHGHLKQIPIDVHGWRASSLHCAPGSCNLIWKRGSGALLEDLLQARPNVRIHEEDFDQARESLVLAINPDDGERPRLQLLPHLSFYETASARAITLREHGMEVEIGTAAPLVPDPPGVNIPALIYTPREEDATDSPKSNSPDHHDDLIAKTTEGTTTIPASWSSDPDHRIAASGTWRLAGHLAFIDAVSGLMRRTGNMSLNTLDIETDTAQPRFTASGDFYVD